MLNLWKKESNCDDAILVDLFAESRELGAVAEWENEFQTSEWNHCIQLEEIKPIKSNIVSDEFRNRGNVSFKQNKWEDAMDSYNHALRFAEVGTRNVSLAYANRSACFQKLNQYAECLLDIDLAIKANYPEHLMSKLMNRKNECQKAMGWRNFTMKQSIPQLDFKPNKKFPCMADVLRIQRNEEFGRHIVASKDIDVGLAILVEKPYVSSVRLFDGTNCCECFGINKNFIACSKCTDVMFCCVDCLDGDEVLHHFCGSNIYRMPNKVKFVAKSILIALTTIPNVDKLMSFVADVLSKRVTGIPEAANDPRSKYATFLSLQPAEKSKYDEQTIHMIYTGLLNDPKVKCIFKSEKSQRFLMHLIMEHALILSNNSFSGNMWGVLTNDAAVCVSSFFNHNCAPNVFNASIQNHEVYITVAPIKKGQQLFISYIYEDQTARERQEALMERWNFICNCDICVPNKSGKKGQSIKHVGIPNFMDLQRKFGELIMKLRRHPRTDEIRAILKQ